MNEINLLEFLVNTFIAILCGISFRFSLGYAKQLWSQTYHYNLTFSLLPAITMVITTMIAGNIALSLGMIGALSIVRFRNPVKNPFELVMFFGLITIGIAMAINYKFGIGLTLIMNIVIIIFKLLEDSFDKKGKKIFSYSFEEGNQFSILQVRSSEKIESLEDHPNLKELLVDKKIKAFNYELIFEKKNDLNELKDKLESEKSIDDLIVKYGQ